MSPRARAVLRLALALTFGPPSLRPPAPAQPLRPAAGPRSFALDGDRAIVRAPGSVEILARRPGGWQTVAVLPDDGEDPDLDGVAIAGDVAVLVGLELHVFTRAADGWHQRATRERSFDAPVAIHGHQILVLDQVEDDHTVLHVTDLDLQDEQTLELAPGTITEASALAIDGDRAAAGTPHGPGGRGAVYAFDCDRHGTWHLRQTFGGAAWFGVSVAVRGDVLAIGDRDDGPGRVHLFRRRGATWQPSQTLAPSAPVLGFGLHVALDAHHLTVVSPWDLDYGDVTHVARYELHDGRATEVPQAMGLVRSRRSVLGFGTWA